MEPIELGVTGALEERLSLGSSTLTASFFAFVVLGFVVLFFFVVSGGLTFELAFGLDFGLTFGLGFGLGLGLSFALSFELSFGLFFGLRSAGVRGSLVAKAKKVTISLISSQTHKQQKLGK